MGFIDFTAGQILTASQMDETFRQTVMRFADASTRDTELTGVLAEGMICYLDDTNAIEKYNGASWESISNPGDITAVTAGTALTGGGASGDVTLDVDLSAITIPQSQVTDLTTDLAGKQDDVITTQGDLVIGDGSGDASRIAIGAADTVLTSNGTTATWAAAGGSGGFDTIEEVTASNSSYDVSGISGVARITLIGGGGGGVKTSSTESGGDGGDTSITISGTTTTASGGAGGGFEATPRPNYAYGSFNGGSGSHFTGGNQGGDGNGGEIKILYADLDGISTVDITVGAGGSDTGNVTNGFRGVVLLEYTA